jgi:FkbM family methyltransferase
VDLYGQETEVELLRSFVPRLEHRAMIDVGAELGSFTAAMLDAGVDAVHAFEPEPGNARMLREHFLNDARVTVHETAVGDGDGHALLHRSSSRDDGAPLTFGHSLLERSPGHEIAWGEPVTVEVRSLASLVAAGEVPARVGILKIDTEGNDLAVLRGLGDLDADVIMVEHWSDLPQNLGPCPWTIDDLTAVLGPRGLSQFAFVARERGFESLRWNDGRAAPGTAGNVVFVHDRVLAALLPELLAAASLLSMRTVEVGAMYADAAAERLTLVERIHGEAEQARAAAESARRRR